MNNNNVTILGWRNYPFRLQCSDSDIVTRSLLSQTPLFLCEVCRKTLTGSRICNETSRWFFSMSVYSHLTCMHCIISSWFSFPSWFPFPSFPATYYVLLFSQEVVVTRSWHNVVMMMPHLLHLSLRMSSSEDLERKRRERRLRLISFFLSLSLLWAKNSKR